MAAETIASRTSNSEQPRPSIPSRTSSLKYFRPNPVHERSNFTLRPSSADANAKELGETLALASSWGASQPQTLISTQRPTSDVANYPTLAEIQQSHSLRGASAGTNVHKKFPSFSTVKMPSRTRATRTKRWAGVSRTVSDWDGLRRDPELWFEDGDCYVHLYALGQSRRGPSFCVPFEALRQSKCGAMFSLCFAQTIPAPGSNPKLTRRISTNFTTLVSKSNTIELYIPAPEAASKEDAFNWHLTTRNFFAWVFNKPLVGGLLGRALVDLQERMRLFRSGQINNSLDFQDYVDSQGYRDFAECADYALAMLYYAEQYKLRDMWIDAFVHCVGMFQSLSFSMEFDPISRLTKSLITRASLEMDIHLSRVSLAVSSFIEDDTSPAFLGLSDGGRAHTDRFRSFLHTFYVEKFGYWPPPKDVAFSKALYKSMYFDFMNLYDYLVDLDSTNDISTQKPASGGICVLQNVDQFNNRHDFIPLPHPLPLLPKYEALSKKTSSQKSLRALTLSSKQSKTDRYVTTRAALTTATNSHDISVTSCPIVHAYMRFEHQCALNQRDEKVSMADARKIRWMVIYGTLQWLISAIRAPKEVRDTEGAEYPLCCLVTEQSPWQVGAKPLVTPKADSINVPEAINDYLSDSNSEASSQAPPSDSQAQTIQPDCENEDYFTHTNPDATPLTSRPVSVEVPQPLRVSSVNPPLMPTRSLKRLSWSARNSRRNSFTLQTPQQPNDTLSGSVSLPVSRSGSLINRSNRSSRPVLPTGSGSASTRLRIDYVASEHTPRHSKRPSKLELCADDIIVEQVRTPCLDSLAMDQIITADSSIGSSVSSDTTDSADPFWSDQSSTSSKSSAHGEPLERKNSDAEISGLLGGLVPVESSPVSTPNRSPSSKKTSPMSRKSRDGFFFDFGHISTSTADSAPLNASSSTFEFGFHALSEPPSPSGYAPPSQFAASLSVDSLPLHQSPRPVVRSNSVKFRSPLAPLSMNPPNPDPMHPKAAISPPVVAPPAAPVKKEGATMDIFSALSLPPDEHGQPKEHSVGRIAIEKGRSVSAAFLSSKKTSKVETKTAVSETEKSKKRERRKSFWRR